MMPIYYYGGGPFSFTDFFVGVGITLAVLLAMLFCLWTVLEWLDGGRVFGLEDSFKKPNHSLVKCFWLNFKWFWALRKRII
jgi:hypothetical protein